MVRENVFNKKVYADENFPRRIERTKILQQTSGNMGYIFLH